MSVKLPFKPVVVLLLGLWVSQPVTAANSIWPARETSQSKMISDYTSLACPIQPPAAYTGRLQLDSKYDQSEATKTTLTTVSRSTKEIRDQIKEYNNGLLQIVTRFERASSPGEVNITLACLDTWLDAWAREGALLTKDVSGTGKAVRKWSLSAISSSLLKARALSNNHFTLSSVTQNWLGRLSEAVIGDYSPRQRLDYAWFNNHDYWAAWSVAATGMLLDRNDYISWATNTLKLALEQAKRGAGDYYYFPLEMARANLAMDYMNYALVPLVLMAETAEANGSILTTTERTRLDKIVNLAALGVLREGSVSELTEKQNEVPVHKMVWLLPYLSRQPQHALAAELYKKVGGNVGYYGQVGGDLRHFYPSID